MAKVELKQPIVDEIAELINGAQSIVLVDYRGLTVDEDTRLRRSFREAGIEYKVYKNTLIKRAIAGTAFEPVAEILEGPTAIAVSKEDATAPARVIYQNMKEMPKLEVKGGMVEDQYYDAAGMEQVSKIPSREILLGKLLGSIQSPIANLARVLNQIAENKEEVA
jgi:large subunit ribosomal protein L10